MNRSGLGLLTPRETECLRLVGQLYNDKQIARALSIEPSTVKTLIGRAMRKLDVSARSEAARALRDYEACHPHWGTDRQGGHPAGDVMPRVTASTPVAEVDAGRFEEARATFDVVQVPDGVRRASQGRVIRVSGVQRVALAVATTFLMVVVVIASVPMADAVQRVAQRYSPGFSTR